jgi:phage-related protein
MPNIWGRDIKRPAKMPVVFYRTPAGAEVVRTWLRGLDKGDRHAVGQDLMRLQYRRPIGMPLCRGLGGALWEVRSVLPSQRIARLMFSIVDGRIVMLHGFIKKARKTPDADLRLARKRQSEFD